MPLNAIETTHHTPRVSQNWVVILEGQSHDDAAVALELYPKAEGVLNVEHDQKWNNHKSLFNSWINYWTGKNMPMKRTPSNFYLNLTGSRASYH